MLNLSNLFLLQKRKRSFLFLIPTAEEQGLLGSLHYIQNPVFPLEKTVGVFNMDLVNIFGKTKDIAFYGYGIWFYFYFLFSFFFFPFSL